MVKWHCGLLLSWNACTGNLSTLAWGVPSKVINISQYEMVMIGMVDCCGSLKLIWGLWACLSAYIVPWMVMNWHWWTVVLSFRDACTGNLSTLAWGVPTKVIAISQMKWSWLACGLVTVSNLMWGLWHAQGHFKLHESEYKVTILLSLECMYWQSEHPSMRCSFKGDLYITVLKWSWLALWTVVAVSNWCEVCGMLVCHLGNAPGKLAWGIVTVVIDLKLWHEMIMNGYQNPGMVFLESVMNLSQGHNFALLNACTGNQSTLAWGVPSNVIDISQYEMVMMAWWTVVAVPNLMCGLNGMLVCHFFIVERWQNFALLECMIGKLSTLAWGVPSKVINIWLYEMVMIGIVDCCCSLKLMWGLWHACLPPFHEANLERALGTVVTVSIWAP